MTDFEVVILCAVVGIVSALISWKISANFHQGVFAEMLDRLDISEEQLKGIANTMAEEAGLEPEESTDPDAIHIRIEQDGTQLYAYRKDNSEFIGQGSDRETLLARLVTQFPSGARLVLTDEDGAAHIKE